MQVALQSCPFTSGRTTAAVVQLLKVEKVAKDQHYGCLLWARWICARLVDAASSQPYTLVITSANLHLLSGHIIDACVARILALERLSYLLSQARACVSDIDRVDP